MFHAAFALIPWPSPWRSFWALRQRVSQPPCRHPQANTGETLWSVEAVVAPLTLAADHPAVFSHDGERVARLDLGDGPNRAALRSIRPFSNAKRTPRSERRPPEAAFARRQGPGSASIHDSGLLSPHPRLLCQPPKGAAEDFHVAWSRSLVVPPFDRDNRLFPSIGIDHHLRVGGRNKAVVT